MRSIMFIKTSLFTTLPAMESRFVYSIIFCMKKAICLLLCTTFFQLLALSQTTITKWKDDKKGAVSITYDDGNRNQFKYMLPVMERLQIPATFYIITGPIIGSQYPP